MVIIYGEELLAPRPTPKLEAPLVSCPRLHITKLIALTISHEVQYIRRSSVGSPPSSYYFVSPQHSVLRRSDRFSITLRNWRPGFDSRQVQQFFYSAPRKRVSVPHRVFPRGIGDFVGAFAKLRKTTIGSVMSDLRPPTWNKSAFTGRIFMKFHIWILFENLSKKFKFN
jgi:hypothetical protein